MSSPLDIGGDVEIVGLERDFEMEGRRGRVVDVQMADCIVSVGDELLGIVDKGKLAGAACSACGAHPQHERAVMAKLQAERDALQGDVTQLRRIADAHAADASALRDELTRLRTELETTQAAALRRSEHLEQAVRAAVSQQVASLTQALDESCAPPAADAEAERLEEAVRKAEQGRSTAEASLAASHDSAKQALLEARALFQNLCDAFGEQEAFAHGYAQQCLAAQPPRAIAASPRAAVPQWDEPEFVIRVQRKRLDRCGDALSRGLRGIDSCHEWLAQAVQSMGQPRPGPLPPAPLRLFPHHVDPEIGGGGGGGGDTPQKGPKGGEQPPRAGDSPEGGIPRQGTSHSELEKMRSTSRQRFMGTDKENRAKPFTGKSHLISICLDYEGTPSPLNCCVDGDRVTAAAAKAGVQDIVKLYDNTDSSGPTWPSRKNVLDMLEEVGSRCAPGDFLVVHYSGHGGTAEDLDGDEETGFDQTLVLRTPDGEADPLIDDDFSAALATCVDPGVGILVMADACHSGTLLDLSKDSLWGEHKQVVSISGCQDTQCSTDTGDGGAMTNAFLQILGTKIVKDLRKKRKCSVQYIFNRMVESIKQPVVQDEDSDSSEWSANFAPGPGDDESSIDYEDLLMAAVYGVDPGQDMILSWCCNCDPTAVCFPF